MLALLTEEQQMLQEIAAQLAESVGLANPSDLEKVDRAKGWASPGRCRAARPAGPGRRRGTRPHRVSR